MMHVVPLDSATLLNNRAQNNCSCKSFYLNSVSVRITRLVIFFGAVTWLHKLINLKPMNTPISYDMK